MKKERFKQNICETIIGMTFDEAKYHCLSEGYQLQDDNFKFEELNDFYIITVVNYDEDSKILKSKYGK